MTKKNLKSIAFVIVSIIAILIMVLTNNNNVAITSSRQLYITPQEGESLISERTLSTSALTENLFFDNV